MGLKRLPRTRRVVKWSGLVLSLLLLAGQGLGRFGYIEWVHRRGLLSLSHGSLRIVSATWSNPRGLPVLRADWYAKQARQWILLPKKAPFASDWFIPLWMLAALIAIPTGILWYLDHRRPPPGRCLQCGYDVRASPERCPECGEPVGEAGRKEPQMHTDEHR